jgi:hypothetical protein
LPLKILFFRRSLLLEMLSIVGGQPLVVSPC